MNNASHHALLAWYQVIHTTDKTRRVVWTGRGSGPQAVLARMLGETGSPDDGYWEVLPAWQYQIRRTIQGRTMEMAALFIALSPEAAIGQMIKATRYNDDGTWTAHLYSSVTGVRRALRYAICTNP